MCAQCVCMCAQCVCTWALNSIVYFAHCLAASTIFPLPPIKPNLSLPHTHHHLLVPSTPMQSYSAHSFSSHVETISIMVVKNHGFLNFAQPAWVFLINPAFFTKKMFLEGEKMVNFFTFSFITKYKIYAIYFNVKVCL